MKDITNPVDLAKKALRNPRKALVKVNTLAHTLGGVRSFYPKGIEVFEEDWDNLIILDACRFGAFSSIAAPELEGKLSYRYSKGTSTKHWVRGNFGPGLHDTVYVTGNTWVARLQEQLDIELHDLRAIIRRDKPTTHDDVAEEARAAADENPNKRLLIHFTLPHHPFIGPTAKDQFPPYKTQQEPNFFTDLTEGRLNISDEALKEAHRENLEVVLPTVNQLTEYLNGKTVISSDHGEMLGERSTPIPVKAYGHPTGLFNKPLVQIPWFECAYSERREIRSDPSKNTNIPTSEEVEQQLRDLGYKI